MTRGIKHPPKQCERCGKDFTPRRGEGGTRWAGRKYCSHECYQLANRGTTWNIRTVRICPICGDEFRREREDHNVETCGKEDCRRRYRLEISGPKRAATMRRQYASGERKPPGQFERMMCPLLLPKGWVYRLAWHDANGGIELDFADVDKKLNVELDGNEHSIARNRRADEARDAELERRGWRILRIPNADVDESPEKVARRIIRWAKSA